MIIFPDIEIQGGLSVNRFRGQQELPETYELSPLDAARGFVAAGAEYLHVVDIDSSLSFGRINSELIGEIIDAVNVPVQVGGGIQTLSDIEWWLDRGAARVVLGTVAVVDRHLTMAACSQFPGKIVISITGKDGVALIEGWRTRTSFRPLELARSFESSGAAAIIYADLDRFEGGPDVGLASTIEIGTELRIPLISTGTVYSLDDVSTLALLPNIEGVVIGRALFNGTVDLAEAIAVARSTVAPELAEAGVPPRHHGVAGVPVSGINRVGIYTSNRERSAEFYSKLGFAAEDETASDGPVSMRHFSGVGINLHPVGDEPVSPISITLQVESIAQTRECLEYNGIPFHDDDGDTISENIHVRDPDGNRIEFDIYG